MAGDEEGGLIYGLEYQCRALCAVEGDSERVRFLVGTQSLKLENQIHELCLDEDTRALSKVIYSHSAGEVWQLAACPTDPSLVISRYSSVDGGSVKTLATIWKRQFDEYQDSSGMRPLEQLSSFDVSGLDTTHVSWTPGGDARKVVALVDNQLTLHDIDAAEAKPAAAAKLEGKGQTKLSTGAWNPHQNCQQYATVNDHHIRGWDLRSMEQAWSFENPGNQVVRSIDFNPNKQYYLACSGDDGCVRFWDVRSPQTPLALRTDHSHWIWSIRYNQFHDQLLLSSSSDCHVVLSSLTSISSEPYGHLLDEDDDCAAEKTVALEDGVIKRYEDHEESVYAAEWSCADPWTFASLSYDGRLVINQVPRAVKFKILNLV